jgi:hypothetical protein
MAITKNLFKILIFFCTLCAFIYYNLSFYDAYSPEEIENIRRSLEIVTDSKEFNKKMKVDLKMFKYFVEYYYGVAETPDLFFEQDSLINETLKGYLFNYEPLGYFSQFLLKINNLFQTSKNFLSNYFSFFEPQELNTVYDTNLENFYKAFYTFKEHLKITGKELSYLTDSEVPKDSSLSSAILDAYKIYKEDSFLRESIYSRRNEAIDRSIQDSVMGSIEEIQKNEVRDPSNSDDFLRSLEEEITKSIEEALQKKDNVPLDSFMIEELTEYHTQSLRNFIQSGESLDSESSLKEVLFNFEVYASGEEFLISTIQDFGYLTYFYSFVVSQTDDFLLDYDHLFFKLRSIHLKKEVLREYFDTIEKIGDGDPEACEAIYVHEMNLFRLIITNTILEYSGAAIADNHALLLNQIEGSEAPDFTIRSKLTEEAVDEYFLKFYHETCNLVLKNSNLNMRREDLNYHLKRFLAYLQDSKTEDYRCSPVFYEYLRIFFFKDN